MDTIVAGGGGGDIRGGSDPGLGSTDLRQSLRARETYCTLCTGSLTQVQVTTYLCQSLRDWETCCTGALTQVRYTHITVSITQGPGDMLHRGSDPGQVYPHTCVNHSGPLRPSVAITPETHNLRSSNDPGQIPTGLC
jgi:hypothetical protein